MYDPYEDEGLMYWLQNTERGMLELAYLDLLRDFRRVKDKYSKYLIEAGWEQTARQQERSGGQM